MEQEWISRRRRLDQKLFSGAGKVSQAMPNSFRNRRRLWPTRLDIAYCFIGCDEEVASRKADFDLTVTQLATVNGANQDAGQLMYPPPPCLSGTRAHLFHAIRTEAQIAWNSYG